MKRRPERPRFLTPSKSIVRPRSTATLEVQVIFSGQVSGQPQNSIIAYQQEKIVNITDPPSIEPFGPGADGAEGQAPVASFANWQIRFRCEAFLLAVGEQEFYPGESRDYMCLNFIAMAEILSGPSLGDPGGGWVNADSFLAPDVRYTTMRMFYEFAKNDSSVLVDFIVNYRP
jgi:hypothetical protein